jgi:hypothetical protein
VRQKVNIMLLSARPARPRLGFALVVVLAAPLAVACSSKNTLTGTNDGGTAASCSDAPQLANADFCKSCTPAATRTPNACTVARSIDACCSWVQAPVVEVTRGTGLHYFTSNDPTVDLGCLVTPPEQGTPKNVTVKGFVKLFASGGDSQGVTIEIFKEGANGALGEPVGTSFTTTSDDAKDPPQMPLPTWSNKCPPDGCKLRSYTIENVPTETPLIVKTRDDKGGSVWAELYDYNIYFANSAVDGNGVVAYDASAVAATDVNTVASAAGGLTVKADRGVIAGEVHDCADVRLSGAMVDSDLAHEGPMFYFGENEADPLPDQSRAPQGLGTSKLGLFGALNFVTGTPIRLSAVGKHDGKTVLLGTHVVQVFPGAVTALSFRGRRPSQK